MWKNDSAVSKNFVEKTHMFRLFAGKRLTMRAKGVIICLDIRGNSPYAHRFRATLGENRHVVLVFLPPGGNFAKTEDGETPRISPKNYLRCRV